MARVKKLRTYKRKRKHEKTTISAALDFVSVPASSPKQECLAEAGEEIAKIARELAATFSSRIPAATGVYLTSEDSAIVATNGSEAPNAAPFEYGERHPLFGDREHWYKQPVRPYMDEAANRGAEAAMNAYAKLADALAKEHRYTE